MCSRQNCKVNGLVVIDGGIRGILECMAVGVRQKGVVWAWEGGGREWIGGAVVDSGAWLRQ